MLLLPASGGLNGPKFWDFRSLTVRLQLVWFGTLKANASFVDILQRAPIFGALEDLCTPAWGLP